MKTPYFVFILLFSIASFLYSCAHTVIIDSQPPDVEVYVNNELRGKAPQLLDSDEVIKEGILLKDERRELSVRGIRKRYWGYAYSKMVKTFFWGLIARAEDKKQEEKTCGSFFSCFMQELCFMVIWTIPSIFVGLPSVVTPDIYIFNMEIPDDINGYNLKWLDYELVKDVLKEYNLKEMVSFRKEYHREIKEMNAPYYYKGFGIYNNDGVQLVKVIDIRKNATGLMFGAYRHTNRTRFNEGLNKEMRKSEFSFLTEINYTRVLRKNLTLSGNLGYTEGDYHTISGSYVFGLIHFSLSGNYNYSPFSWLGISPGFGAGVFFYDEADAPKRTFLLPVTSLDLNLSPNSLFNFSFTLTARANGFGLLFKNNSLTDGVELLGGFRVMF